MKNTVLLVLALVGMNIWDSTFNRLQAQQVSQLESPDKSFALNVFLSATGEIQYRIQKSGISVIEPSALGAMMKGHNFYATHETDHDFKT